MHLEPDQLPRRVGPSIAARDRREGAADSDGKNNLPYIAHLQRRAGNAAVAQYLSRSNPCRSSLAVQRCGPISHDHCPCQKVVAADETQIDLRTMQRNEAGPESATVEAPPTSSTAFRPRH